MRFFNTGGPCTPNDHYMLPAKHRLDAFDIDRLIQQKNYFVVHAPRQVGKTTAMQMLARELTESGDYISILLSMETGAAFPDDSLKSVVNGCGVIDREYAIGSGRMDLYIRYGAAEPAVQMAMELKVWRDGQPDPLAAGLAQLDSYMSGLSYHYLNESQTAVETGWLVIFDQRSGQPAISERTSSIPATTPAGRTVTLIRA